MVDYGRKKKKDGTPNPLRPKNADNYFYLNDQLHKKLKINRGTDQMWTWNYALQKRVVYVYTEVLRKKQRAFTMPEVCFMIKRQRWAIQMAMVRGDIPRPQQSGNGGRTARYRFSEKDVQAVLDYFATVHRGRPRSDDIVVPQELPTPRELRATMRQEDIVYMKDEEGNMRPVWTAGDFS